MILNIIDLFGKKIRATIIPHTLDKNMDRSHYKNWSLPDINTLAVHLPDCLRFIRQTYAILIKLDLPSEALDIVLGIIVDTRIHCMIVMFKREVEKIKKLQEQETWRVKFEYSETGITDLVCMN